MPPNNAVTYSPDPVGTRAAYFVDDFANNQSLYRQIQILTEGTYQIGFSAYAPRNGYNNSNDAQFSGTIATLVLANYFISAGPATTWQSFYGSTYLTPGSYDVRFVFNTNGYPAKDVVIDQVYVLDTRNIVPEPGSLVLLGSGLLGAVRLMRRRPARSR